MRTPVLRPAARQVSSFETRRGAGTAVACGDRAAHGLPPGDVTAGPRPLTPHPRSAMRRPWFVRLSVVVLVGWLPACDDAVTTREPVEESELTFVRMAPDAPALTTTRTSFWAVRGQDRQVEIRYAYEGGYTSKCLLFRVPAESLLRSPEGVPYVTGDSVRITVESVDGKQYRFSFEPEGLRFDPAHPARLEVRYSYADPDLNGDGQVDGIDAAIASDISFWYQPWTGEKWTRIPTTHDANVVEARAPVDGFSQYALAID